MDIVARDTLFCAMASRVPYWWATSPSITGLQLTMLARVSQVYGVEFSQDLARPIVASLAGGGLNLLLAQNPISVALKAWVLTVPVIGLVIRFGTGPLVVASYTYLLGRAFIRHYEAGGSYHNFTSLNVRHEVARIVRGASLDEAAQPALRFAAGTS